MHLLHTALQIKSDIIPAARASVASEMLLRSALASIASAQPSASSATAAEASGLASTESAESLFGESYHDSAQAVASSPRDTGAIASAEAARREGNAHFAAGRYARAIECYTRALAAAADPCDAALLCNRSLAYFYERRPHEALADAEAAARARPDSADAHFRCARALLALGRPVHAFVALDKGDAYIHHSFLAPAGMYSEEFA